MNQPEDTSSTMTIYMLADPGRADNMAEHFASLLYRAVAGRNCPVAASVSTQAYVAIPGLSEQSNRILAMVIARQVEDASCGKVLREILDTEGIVHRVPGHPSAGFTERPRSSTVSPLATPTLLTSKPPLHGGTSEHQIQDSAAPSMTQRRNELGIPGSATPLAWEQTIAACLAKEPSQRPQSATEGDEALGGRRVRIDRSTPVSPAPKQSRPSVAYTVAAIGGLACGALGAVILYFGTKHSNRPAQTPVTSVVPRPMIETQIPERATAAQTPTNTLPTVPAATAAPVIAVAPEPTVTRQSSSYMSWTDQLTQFVRDYVDSTGDSNVERAVSFYAPTADILDEGPKNLDQIRQEIVNFNERWPLRQNSVVGGLQVQEHVRDESYTIRFDQSFYAESAARREWSRGKVAVTLGVTIRGGVPEITSLKQRTLERQKGVLSTASTNRR